jgi:hypothetical protein
MVEKTPDPNGNERYAGVNQYRRSPAKQKHRSDQHERKIRPRIEGLSN